MSVRTFGADTTTWSPEGPYAVDWYNSNNWSNGVPDADKIAIVNILGTEAKEVTVKGLHVGGTGVASLDGVNAEEIIVADQGCLATPKLAVSGELTLAGGTLAGGLTVPQPTEFWIPPGATLRIIGPGDKEVNGHLHLSGIGIWTSDGGRLLLSDRLEIDGGTLEIRSDATIYHPATVNLRPSGRIKISHGRRLVIDGPDFKCDGPIELSDSTLDLRDGTHVFMPSARVIGKGRVHLASGRCHSDGYNTMANANGTGRLALDPGIAIALVPGNDPASEAILRGPLEVTSGFLELWTSNMFGEFDIGPQAHLLITGPDPKEINGRMRLSGRGVLSSAGRLNLGNEGLEVAGILEVQEDATLYYPSGLRVEKLGFVKVAAGRSLVLDGPSLSQAGTVELQNDSCLVLRDGEHVLLPNSSIIGCGTVQLTPGDCHKEGYNVGCQLSGPGPVSLEPGISFIIRPSEPTQAVAVFGPLTIDGGHIEWTGGTLYNDIDLGELTSLTVSGDTPRELNGLLRLRGEGRIDCRAPIAMYNIGIRTSGRLVIASPATLSGTSAVRNSGHLQVRAALQLDGVDLVNAGTVEIIANGLVLTTAQLLMEEIGTLSISIADQSEGASPKVRSESCDLDGTLTLELGYGPREGESIHVLGYTRRQGEFAATQGCPWYWDAEYGATELIERPARPPVPYVLGNPSAAARRACQRMNDSSQAEQLRRIDTYVKAYGFDQSPNYNPKLPLRGEAIRDPRLGMNQDDLNAAYQAAGALGIDAATLLAVWTAEGRYDYRNLMHCSWISFTEQGKFPAPLTTEQWRTYGRSRALYEAFGCDLMISFTPTPNGENQPGGPTADHENPFLKCVTDMRDAGVALALVSNPRGLSRYFRDYALRMRAYQIDSQSWQIDLALARCSLASWLALQGALFELQRHVTESRFQRHYGVAVDLRSRPWVTYVVWNAGLRGFDNHLTKDGHGQPYTNPEAAITGRFGSADQPPEHLSAEQLNLYYRKDGSSGALANAVVLKYLVDTYGPWWEP